MGRRTRQRERAEEPRTETGAPRTDPGASRTEPGASRGPDAPGRTGGDALRRGYARAEARNEEIRRQLEPLAPGERPGAVTVAAIVAALLGLGNVVLLLAGVEVDDESPPVAGTLAFAAVMLVAAAGMWRAKYWAVIGFQALLAFTLVIAGTSLLLASNLAAVALCVGVLGLGGWLFWKLVRALARLQMPRR